MTDMGHLGKRLKKRRGWLADREAGVARERELVRRLSEANAPRSEVQRARRRQREQERLVGYHRPLVLRVELALGRLGGDSLSPDLLRKLRDDGLLPRPHDLVAGIPLHRHYEVQGASWLGSGYVAQAPIALSHQPHVADFGAFGRDLRDGELPKVTEVPRMDFIHPKLLWAADTKYFPRFKGLGAQEVEGRVRQVVATLQKGRLTQIELARGELPSEQWTHRRLRDQVAHRKLTILLPVMDDGFEAFAEAVRARAGRLIGESTEFTRMPLDWDRLIGLAEDAEKAGG